MPPAHPTHPVHPTHPLLACFQFLACDAGFVLEKFSDTPAAFDNCVAHYTRAVAGGAALELRVERDRGQVFVELRRGSGPWQDKDTTLEHLGIARSRHPHDTHGAWTGYQMQVQAQDLQRHLPRLLQHLQTTPSH